MKILAMTSTFEFPLSPKLFDLYVYTRRPGSSAVVPGLDHDVVRAGSHFQVSIESFAVLLVLQPVIHVNLNGEHGARAGDGGMNGNRGSDRRIWGRRWNRNQNRQGSNACFRCV